MLIYSTALKRIAVSIKLIEMDVNNYSIKPWKRYKLPDNGLYAPGGSKPYFVVETTNFKTGTNPLFPYALGHVIHNQQPGNRLIREQKVLISEIGDELTLDEYKSLKNPNFHDVKDKLPPIGELVKVFFETAAYSGHGLWWQGIRVSETHFQMGGPGHEHLRLIDLSDRHCSGVGVTDWAELNEINLPNLCRLHGGDC